MKRSKLIAGAALIAAGAAMAAIPNGVGVNEKPGKVRMISGKSPKSLIFRSSTKVSGWTYGPSPFRGKNKSQRRTLRMAFAQM